MGRKKKLKKELICEDCCFVCKDGGSLRICDYSDCLKAYHPECVGKDESMLYSDEKWACNWHYCFHCHKASKIYCYCCTFAVCDRCFGSADLVLAKRNKGFCSDCLELIRLIEENKEVDTNGHKVDFNDQDTVEYLFKEYWMMIKNTEGFTSQDIVTFSNEFKNGRKGRHDSDSYEYNEEEEVSEFDVAHVGKTTRRRSGVKKDLKSKKKEFIGWGSKLLMEFLTSIGKETHTELSEYDVTTIIMEYCKVNNLFHPEKKKKIICDAKLQPLFRRKLVNRNSIPNLLSAHLAENVHQSEDESESYSQNLDKDDPIGAKRKKLEELRPVKRPRVTKEVVAVKESCFAAIVPKNIKLVYLRKSLVANLSKQIDYFDDKVMESFVRVKSDPNDYLQKNAYQLVQVIGINKLSTPNPQISLKLTNVVKAVPITQLSDDDFSQEEIDDLCQRIKNGLVKRPTVVWLELKAKSLHEDITKHWIEREIIFLQRRSDWANEKGWRKELNEYLDKLMLLQRPDEQTRLLSQAPEVIAETIQEVQECQDGSLALAPSGTSKTSSCNLLGASAVPNAMNQVNEDVAGKSKIIEVKISPASANANRILLEPPTLSPQAHTHSATPTQSSPLSSPSNSTPPSALFSPSVSPNQVNSMPQETRNVMVSCTSAEQCSSTSLPPQVMNSRIFANLGEAQAFFAEMDRILEESLKNFPETLPAQAAPQDIEDAKSILYQYRYLNFEALIHPEQRDEVNSSLELLLKSNFFPPSVAEMVKKFHMDLDRKAKLYIKSQETLQAFEKNVEDTLSIKEEVMNNHCRFNKVMKDVEDVKGEINELTKQRDKLNKRIEEKEKLRGDMEAEANNLVQWSSTSKDAIAGLVQDHKKLEEERKIAVETIDDIEGLWEQLRIQTERFV